MEPNSGVAFTVGCYNLELFVVSGYGRSRKFTISNEDNLAYGLHPRELIAQLELDIALMRNTIENFVEVSRIEQEREMEEYRTKKKEEGEKK